MKQYPAIDVRTDVPDLLLAIVDDFGPTAVEERGDLTRIFFASTTDRDAARRSTSTTKTGHGARRRTSRPSRWGESRSRRRGRTSGSDLAFFAALSTSEKIKI